MNTENTSPEELSDFKLKISYWYVSHKWQLRKALIIFLVVANIGLYGWVLYRASWMFFVEQPKYLQMIRGLSMPLQEYSYVRDVTAATPLRISSFTALPQTDGGYDFVAVVSNPNDNWVVRSGTVHLLANGEVVADSNFFIYPAQEKYVMFFNQTDINPNTASIRFDDLQWLRVSDFEAVTTPRLNFTISEAAFDTITQRNELGTQQPFTSMNFSITNTTAYSYWRVGLRIVIFNGSAISATNYIAVDQLVAGETRNVSVSWPQNIPSFSTYVIVPEVDILNPDSYMPVQ